MECIEIAIHMRIPI